MSDSSDTKKPHYLKAALDLQARILYSKLPEELKPTALAYALHLNNHSRQTRPSVTRIAQLLGKDRRTIGRHLDQLEALKVFVPHRRDGSLSKRTRPGGRGEAGITPYSIDVDALPLNGHINCDTSVAVSDSTDDLPLEDENCDADVAVSDSAVSETATPVAETATPVTGNCDTGVAGTVRTELGTELGTGEVPTQIDRNSEQSREKTRATTPDVAITGHGWHPWESQTDLDAYLATMAMPGPFASPPQARMFGYRIFKAHPDEPVLNLSYRLYDELLKMAINTSREQCLAAMCDVLNDRAQRDRTYDRKADLDRRAGRR